MIRIAAVLSIAGLAFLTGLAGCGDDSGSDTVEAEIAKGVTISVPSDADQSPKEFLSDTLNAVADKVGFSDEWKACIASEIDSIPDARLEPILDAPDGEASTQAALKYNAQISAACEKKVAEAVDPDATSEQIDALRALTASQLTQTFEGSGASDKQAACMVEQYEALSDNEAVEFANLSARQSFQTLSEWARGCA